ncbi:MAG: bifunctional [glutamate--ammonia ligase]-adenylyl-L-tyrosine phosphorylase/[glutamate--ammonia-ligase] adenylyltransferase, partial [Herbaspirillum sp.]
MPNSLLTSLVASRFLARWLHADPARITLLTDTARLSPSTAQFVEFLQKQTDAGISLPAAMRRLRNLTIATLIERDLSGNADLNEVVSVMSTFADFAIRTHLNALMQQEIVLHGVPTGEESGLPQQLIVLGMGKLGGAELNASSDIDLIFIYPEEGDCVTTLPEQRSLSNHEFFTRLGKKLIGALSEVTKDGFTFRVDMDLRPNGASGPLVANLNMLERYLIVQGRDWERYAWLKARPITGDAADITALEQIVRPFIYRRYLDFGSIDALRALHRQIRAEVTRQELRHPDRSENIKLGRGGIRAIEFLAQVFQLIRGGREPQLRDRSTRATLAILAEKGLLSADAVAQLQTAYTFLRNLEHRLQYVDDAQTHTLPTKPEDRLHIAQMMGYSDVDALLA